MDLLHVWISKKFNFIRNPWKFYDRKWMVWRERSATLFIRRTTSHTPAALYSIPFIFQPVICLDPWWGLGWLRLLAEWHFEWEAVAWIRRRLDRCRTNTPPCADKSEQGISNGVAKAINNDSGVAELNTAKEINKNQIKPRVNISVSVNIDSLTIHNDNYTTNAWSSIRIWSCDAQLSSYILPADIDRD